MCLFQFTLYLSKDFGLSWDAIKRNVMDYSWGTSSMDKELIFLVTDDVDPTEDTKEGKIMDTCLVNIKLTDHVA